MPAACRAPLPATPCGVHRSPPAMPLQHKQPYIRWTQKAGLIGHTKCHTTALNTILAVATIPYTCYCSTPGCAISRLAPGAAALHCRLTYCCMRLSAARSSAGRPTGPAGCPLCCRHASQSGQGEGRARPTPQCAARQPQMWRPLAWLRPAQGAPGPPCHHCRVTCKLWSTRPSKRTSACAIGEPESKIRVSGEWRATGLGADGGGQSGQAAPGINARRSPPSRALTGRAGPRMAG